MRNNNKQSLHCDNRKIHMLTQVAPPLRTSVCNKVSYDDYDFKFTDKWDEVTCRTCLKDRKWVDKRDKKPRTSFFDKLFKGAKPT